MTEEWIDSKDIIPALGQVVELKGKDGKWWVIGFESDGVPDWMRFGYDNRMWVWPQHHVYRNWHRRCPHCGKVIDG